MVVDGNTALENELDCQDRSGPGGSGTAGTENGWRHNVGVTDPCACAYHPRSM